jgi:hypothetical protein
VGPSAGVHRQSDRINPASADGGDGFWRWAFRGGSSEQGYRSLVAATVSWLLGAADSTGAKAKPVRTVVANARPLVFEWSGTGGPQPLAVQFSDSAGQRSDTLRFDGSGHAEVRLPVGTYHYRLEGSGEGTVAVEQYSDEWLPRTVALQDHPVSGNRPTLPPVLANGCGCSASASRDWRVSGGRGGGWG